MKKFILSVAIIAAGLFGFTACEDDGTPKCWKITYESERHGKMVYHEWGIKSEIIGYLDYAKEDHQANGDYFKYTISKANVADEESCIELDDNL